MPRRIRHVLAASVLAFLAGGCSEPGLDAWVTGEMTRLTRTTPRQDDPLIYDASDHAVRLFGGSNETLSFQIAVELTPEQRRAIGKLNVEVSDLTSPNGRRVEAARVRLFRMKPVRITDYPAWMLRLSDRPPEPLDVYDALIPAPLDRPARGGSELPQRLAYWVDVTIPRGTWPGVYSGRITLRSEMRPAMDLPRELDWMRTRNVEQLTWSVNLRVKVYDFVLPDARPVAAVGGFDYRTLFGAYIRTEGRPYRPTHLNPDSPRVRRGLTIMRQMMRLAHRHRLDLFERTLRPVLKRDRDGNAVLHWDEYDRIVRPYLDGSAFRPESRVGVSAWPMPLRDDWPDPNHYGGRDSKRYGRTFSQVARLTADHFLTELNAGEQAFAWLHRGAVRRQAYGDQLRMASLLRGTRRELPILSQLPTNPPSPTGWTVPKGLDDVTDIHAAPGRWFLPGVAAVKRDPRRRLAGGWISPGQPPYFPGLGVVATGPDPRALAWFVEKYRATGLFLPEVLDWSEDPYAAPARAQARLFYPAPELGDEVVLPSVRLKRLRRGLQDLAYFWILRQRNRRAVAAAVISALTHYGGQGASGDHYLDPRLDGWVQDPAAWQIARRLLAEEIQAVVSPATGSAEQLVRTQGRWDEFLRKHRQIRLERARTFVRPVLARREDGTVDRRFGATVYLEVYNELGREVPVTITPVALPEGWQLRKTEVEAALAPYSRGEITLRMEGSTVPLSKTGKVPVRFEIRAANRPPQHHTVMLPIVRAGATTPRLRVDGNLRDWPIRSGNVAGGFRLIGKPGRSDHPRPEHQTRAFVLADRETLYLAIRCDEPNPRGMTTRRTNFVRYQQLLACGEDLVEIVLDPGRRGRRASDLYHMVIKPNGVVTATRGVDSKPPLGKVTPWSHGARVAVETDGTGWVIEMSIPRSAFGADGNSEMWGLNVARFRPASREASNWAECKRYYYSPLNLGTLYVP
jgi:hypothetical protein